jgi:hypothetical protein
MCKSTLDFMKILLETEIIRIDFVVSRTGLMQVLINLLKFYCENMSNSAENNKSGTKKEPGVLVSLKNLFSLICRLLLKLNENQDTDLFSYYCNSLINLCFNSNSNSEFQSLNLAVKEIFLNITNSIIGDLNYIYTNTTETQTASVSSTVSAKSTALLKKFMNPLLSSAPSAKTENLSSNNNQTSNVKKDNTSTSANSPSMLASGLFDSDIIFQKFICFIVDFIHIVFDKISDTQLDDTQYDVNDQLSISGFTVLAECLAISLENNQRAKFTSLFRNNLNLIRFQVCAFV